MRGTVLFNNTPFLWGEKISTIILALSFISPEQDRIRKWPQSVNFYMPGDTSRICSHIHLILKVCSIKKKRSGLGFITLVSDGNGRYWFKGTPGFAGAVSESLMSLELLADEMTTETDQSCLKAINKVYRKLSEVYESL
jgi:hypothetical protein